MATPDLTFAAISARMAQEGIPVGAIGRVLLMSFEDTTAMLQEELAQGHIVEIPKSDWPPTARLSDHLPTVQRKVSDADVEIACRKMFKLTNLEAGFLVLLLKLDHADKAKLHHVIETQRLSRQTRPDKMELTDQKMVDVMICKLRKKLRTVDEVFIITTVWGGGYYIEPAVKEKIYDRLAVEGVVRHHAHISSEPVHAVNGESDPSGSDAHAG